MEFVGGAVLNSRIRLGVFMTPRLPRQKENLENLVGVLLAFFGPYGKKEIKLFFEDVPFSKSRLKAYFVSSFVLGLGY